MAEYVRTREIRNESNPNEERGAEDSKTETGATTAILSRCPICLREHDGRRICTCWRQDAEGNIIKI